MFIKSHLKNVRKTKSFTQKVLDVVCRIPRGSVLSYKQVAQKAGSPNACRAVGTILKKNFNSKIPCHRVIKSSGELGKYNRGVNKKRKILQKEGYL